MITLALYEQMIADGVAGLVGGKDFFWEEVPLQKDGSPCTGVWLVTRPGNISNSRKGLNLKTTVDFYVAAKSKVKTELIHQQIRQYFEQRLGFCELSGSVGGVSYSFTNVRLRPTSTPQNVGATPNNLIVKVASVELVYDENDKRKEING